jgi:hypothetical protein
LYSCTNEVIPEIAKVSASDSSKKIATISKEIDALMPQIQAEYLKKKSEGSVHLSFEAFLQKQLDMKLKQQVIVQPISNPQVKFYKPNTVLPLPNDGIPRTQSDEPFKIDLGVDASLSVYPSDFGTYTNYVAMELMVFRRDTGMPYYPISSSFWPYLEPYATSWSVVISYVTVNSYGSFVLNTFTYDGIGITYGMTFISPTPISVNITASNAGYVCSKTL